MQTTNNKSMCKTFADRANQLLFVNLYLEKKDDADSKHASVPINPHPFLHSSTYAEAIALKECMLNGSDTLMHTELCDGIMIGKESILLLDTQQIADIEYWVQAGNLALSTSTQDNMHHVARAFKKVVKINSYGIASIYRVGEYVAVQDHLSEGTEWIVQITGFFVYGPVNNEYAHFFNGNYFSAKTLADGSVDEDEWTIQPKLVRKQYRRLCIQPVRYIERKVMLYAIDTRHNQYLCIDPNHCVSISTIDVPHYPELSEVVEVKGSVYFIVAEVEAETEQVKCHPLYKVGSFNPRWKPSLLETVTQPFSDIIRNIPYDKRAGCYYENFVLCAYNTDLNKYMCNDSQFISLSLLTKSDHHFSIPIKYPTYMMQHGLSCACVVNSVITLSPSLKRVGSPVVAMCTSNPLRVP